MRTNIRFLNDESRRHHLIAHVSGAQVYQVWSLKSQGSFYTLEAYITLRNLMNQEDLETHTATPWDASLAAFQTDKIYTVEDVLGRLDFS